MQIASSELPFKALSQPLVVLFELVQASGKSRQEGKIIGCEDFALDNAEIDFDLIKPTGVDGAMDQGQVGIAPFEALDGTLASAGQPLSTIQNTRRASR